LSLELEWTSKWRKWFCGWSLCKGAGPTMRAPIVRGSPYTSIEYLKATPRLFAQRAMNSDPVIDEGRGDKTLICGKNGVFSKHPVLVERELKLTFDTSDMTWIVFLSEPASFICTRQDAVLDVPKPSAPGVVLPPVDPMRLPYFELRAVQPMARGMVRVAMSTNCTNNQNPIYCGKGGARENKAYEGLLRKHSDLYAGTDSDVEFTFPEERNATGDTELRLVFNWKVAKNV
jgi:hypothetical protein